MGRRDLRRYGFAERDPASGAQPPLRPMARAGGISALQPGIFAVQVAELVGLRRRRVGGLRLSLHGLAALGAGVEPSALGRTRGRSPRSRGIDAAMADCSLRISGARRKTGRRADLVSWRQTTSLALGRTG